MEVYSGTRNERETIASTGGFRAALLDGPTPIQRLQRMGENRAVDQYRLMAEASGAVLNGNPVPLSPADSIANMRVLDAIAASAKLGEASGCSF